MNVTMKRFRNAYLPLVGSLIFLMSLTAVAQDTEGELFNQLYREIISSAADGGAVTMDSLFPNVEQERLLNKKKDSDTEISHDAAAEQLKEEIDKMVGEVRTRHSEKVRFMQDGNNK